MQQQVLYPKFNSKTRWIFLFFMSWQIIGSYVDGWAHNNLLSSLESFFTPWHGIFYAGFTASGFWLVYNSYQNYKKGFPLRRSLPKSFVVSLLGVGIFYLGGFGDLIWHTVFGIEANIDALLSPTHLLLALGGGLMASWGLRSILLEEEWSVWQIVFSAVQTLLVINFMLQFTHPFYAPWMKLVNRTVFEPNNGLIMGATAILVYSTIISGMILFLHKYLKRLPLGALTLLIFLDASGQVLMYSRHFELLLFAFIACVVCEILYLKFVDRPKVFGFLLPFTVFTTYTIGIVVTSGTWWSVHFAAGIPVIAGMCGWLVSSLIFQKINNQKYEFSN